MEVVHPRLGREAVVATPATRFPEPWMDTHQNARKKRYSRMLTEQAGEEIEALRRQRITGPATARRLGRPVSTIGVVVRRRGALDPRPSVLGYQRECPGELIHIDIRKLGRIDGIGHRISGHHTGMVRNRGIG